MHRYTYWKHILTHQDIHMYACMYVCVPKRLRTRRVLVCMHHLWPSRHEGGSNVRAHVFLPGSIHHHCQNSFLMFWLGFGTLLLHQPVYRTQTPPLCTVQYMQHHTHSHTLQCNVSATATIKHHKTCTK